MMNTSSKIGSKFLLRSTKNRNVSHIISSCMPLPSSSIFKPTFTTLSIQNVPFIKDMLLQQGRTRANATISRRTNIIMNTVPQTKITLFRRNHLHNYSSSSLSSSATFHANPKNVVNSSSSNINNNNNNNFDDNQTKPKKRQVRLSKRMSELNLCSRREADKFISGSSNDVISVLVQNKPVPPIMGQKVDADEMDIRIVRRSSHSNSLEDCKVVAEEREDDVGDDGDDDDGHRRELAQFDLDWDRMRGDTVVLHKPVGYVSGQPDWRHGHVPAVRLLTRDNLFLPDEDEYLEIRETLSLGRYLHFAKRGGRTMSRRKQQIRRGDAWEDNDDKVRKRLMTMEPTSSTSTLINYAPAGRLDLDSSGLLIFTKCGVMAKKLLTTPSSIHKEYIVNVLAPPSIPNPLSHRTKSKLKTPTRNWNLRPLLRGGIQLKGDDKPLLPVISAEWIQKDGLVTRSSAAKHSNPSERKEPEKKGGILRIVLNEGKNRQIRRMCSEILGLQVTKLERRRIGNLITIDDLPIGMWRPLRKEEARDIFFPDACADL